MTNELNDVRCPCGAEFQADSYDAGFIAGSGMCQNCDAAMPPKDIPAPVEQAGGDEGAGLRAAAKWHRGQRNAFEAEAEMHRQRYENTNRPDSLTAEAEHHRRLWETASAMAANHLDYAAGFEEMARAALAIASSAQTEHERDMLGQALGECIEAAGIIAPGAPLTGPQLLMFAEDLKRDLQRAALAQPSPKCATCNDNGVIGGFVGADSGYQDDPCPDCAQAEAERPEVVAWQYRVTAGPQTGWSLWHPGKGEEFERSYTVERRPLMTVAQHDRIVGELRAVIAQLRQHKNDYMDSGQETYRALQNEIREREAEIARLDGLVSGRTAERDAALAEVERLRQFERICGGLPQDAIDGGWTVQGIRGYAKRLEDQLKVALDRVAELENQEPVAYVLFRDGEVYYETDDNIVISNTPGDETDLYMWLPVFTAPVAQAPRSDHSELRRIAVALKNPLLSGDEASDLMVRYEALTMPDHIIALIDSQALHSVPEASEQEKEQGWTLDYRFVERVTDLAASRTEYTTSMEATEQVLLAARELLAAAPGKEGM